MYPVLIFDLCREKTCKQSAQSDQSFSCLLFGKYNYLCCRMRKFMFFLV